MSTLNWEKETKLPLVTSCKQAARLVSIAFERKLTLREYLTMLVHLFNCKTCSLYRRQIAALRKAFVRHEEVLDNTPCSSPECLDAAVKARLKAVVAKHL